MNKKIKTVVGVAAGVCAGTVGTGLLAPAVLGVMGFTAGGISVGSVASGMMSSAAVVNGGGVAAGSLVAVLQSVGAAGFTAATTAGVAFTGGVIGGVLGWFSGKRGRRQPDHQPESVRLSVIETGDSSETEEGEPLK